MLYQRNLNLNYYIKGIRFNFRTYDADKDYERMKKAGVFQSVRPDGSVGEGW